MSQVCTSALSVFAHPAFGGARRVTAIPVAQAGLHVDVLGGGDEVVLRVHGEADIATAHVLRNALASPSTSDPTLRRLVLDLEDLCFIDAFCIGIIEHARSGLQELGRDLVIRAPTSSTRRVFEICGLDEMFEISPTVGFAG